MTPDESDNETQQSARETQDGFVVDETRTRINQGNVQMQVHQPHGSLQLIRLYDGVELHSRVTEEARANTSIQLSWEQAERLYEKLGEVIEDAE